MKKTHLLALVVTLGTLLHSSMVWAAKLPQNTITIAADSWCPINCTRPETKEGVGIDLARAIFELMGYKINYVIMSWDDALKKVRSGSVDAVVGAGRPDDPNLVFPNSPILTMSDDFYVLKGVSWRWQGIESLKRKRLGITEGYGYGKTVSDYIRANSNMNGVIYAASGSNPLRDNIAKLQSRQIDIIVETKPVMEYTLERMGLADKVTWAGGMSQDPVYLAFSPSKPGSAVLAKIYDDGIKRLRASSKLNGFYSAYGLRAE